MIYDDDMNYNIQQQQPMFYRPMTSLWAAAEEEEESSSSGGYWKMEPNSPPSPSLSSPSPSPPPPLPSSPFVDLDTDSWFQNGGGNLAAAANVHTQQNVSNSSLLQQQHPNHHYYHHHQAACQSPDLIVPDTTGFYDVTVAGSGGYFADDDVTKPASRGEAAQKLLNDLDELIKEEPFSDWYEEKIDLPIFEELETVQPAPVASLITRRSDVPALLLCQNTAKMASAGVVQQQHQYAKMASAGVVQQQQQHQYAKMAAATPIPVALIGGGGVGGPVTPPQQPPSLMQEFDFVLSHHQQQQQHQQHHEQMLTPPESPERAGGVEGVSAISMLQNMPTEELDELVRIRVESLVEGGGEDSCSSYSYSAEAEAEGGTGGEREEECLSSSGSEGGRSSPAPSIEDSSSSSSGSDPEWSPTAATKCDLQPGAGPAASQSKRRRQSGATSSGGKPYSRPPPEEKRQRKKEQNKNAATRYRLKKKAEIEEILGEERGLLDRNHQLKTDLGELQREIKYIKSLMREMLQRKKDSIK